ncbi:G-protein coupled receptor GRL101-like [Pecten maximus]|uniref:G-protein coupled receptor GRL101-like n=1 Tax=Pecten maximus TaxID=6579 RepID=UPI0014589D18|nr:G-protein coupled receptor GRL101-like [Pecten maximus]
MDAEENLCPPGKSPQLMEYKCCIYCPEHEKVAGCEPYNCTEINACLSINDRPRRIRLILTKKNIATLPNNVFNGVSKVTDLNLSKNIIQVLPHNVFNGLTKLTMLDLGYAVSDLLMGIYLLIIGVVGAYYEGVYAWNDQKWRNSILCTTAGILSSISSEMSTFLILMVTVDRLIVIMFPLSRLSQRSITWKHALVVSLILWIVAVILGIIPVVTLQSYFKGEFYSQSSVCLALPLKGDARPGTEYSFAVFVCLNSIVFLIIVVCQICICKSLRRSGRRSASSQNRQREITVATTLFFVVATDFCCWFPVGVMGVVSRFGIEIPDWVYAWVMVFVLPINAAINPFLYTATAVWRGRRKSNYL